MRLLSILFILTIILLSGSITTKDKNTQKEKVETPKIAEHVEPQNNNEQVQKEEPQVSKEPEVATIDLPKEPESSPKNPVNYASTDLFEVIFKKIDGDAPICSEKVDLKAVF